jgi:hypothetical protein
MAIDNARTNLYDRVEGARNAPPFALGFFSQMAILVLQMGHEEGTMMQQSMEQIKSLTTYLSVAGEKWKLAGKH